MKDLKSMKNIKLIAEDFETINSEENKGDLVMNYLRPKSCPIANALKRMGYKSSVGATFINIWDGRKVLATLTINGDYSEVNKIYKNISNGSEYGLIEVTEVEVYDDEVNIFNLTDDNVTEICENFNLEDEDNVVTYFGLTGNIIIGKTPRWSSEEGYTEYTFYCGAETEGGYVSDCIFIDGYLTKIAEEMVLDLDVGAAEAYHEIRGVKSEEEAEEILKRIKERIESDGYTCNVLS